jgi:hypothetical protein
MMKILLGLLLGIFVLFGQKNFALASDPHLFLSPASGSYPSGFTVEIKVDTGGKSTGGVDIHLEYPKNLLKIENVVKGGTNKDPAFSELYSQIKNDEGKLRINAYYPFTEAGKSFNGNNGLIATVSFTPLSTGTAAVNFICNTGSTTESNIVDKITVQDVIVCTSNVNASYVLTAAGGTQPTTTPTAAGGTQPTATPTAAGGTQPTATPTLPQSGSVAQTIGLIGIGIITLLTGVALAL